MFIVADLVSWSNLYMLNWRFEPPYVILVPTSHGQMHRLISHAGAVELAFVLIYIYKQQMLRCVYWHVLQARMSLHCWTKIKCAYLFDILFTLIFIINLVWFGTYKR